MLKQADLKKIIKNKKGNAFPHFINNNKLLKCKKAVSEMIAYVILISIALGLAVAIYAYLSYVVNIVKPPIDCPEGTTISLESYECDTLTGYIRLTIKNTGRFNVDGIMAKFSDNLSKEPVVMLQPNTAGTEGMPGQTTPGHFSFALLSPGTSKVAQFSPVNESNLPYITLDGTVKLVQIQPFKKGKRKIACIGTIIKEPLTNPECRIV